MTNTLDNPYSVELDTLLAEYKIQVRKQIRWNIVWIAFALCILPSVLMIPETPLVALSFLICAMLAAVGSCVPMFEATAIWDEVMIVLYKNLEQELDILEEV
jgi:hypothetical protein